MLEIAGPVPFCGWSPGQAHGAQLENSLISAVEAGCRHVSSDYNNQNEEEVGAILERLFEAGKFKREDLFISAKLPFIGNNRKRVKHFVRKSLKNLRVSWVDLYVMSSPVGFRYVDDTTVVPCGKDGVNVLLDRKTDIVAVWKAMESMVELGLVKSIGLSHFNAAQLKTIFKYARIQPTVLLVECHPYFQQTELRYLCCDYEVKMIALCPFAVRSDGLYGDVYDSPCRDLLVKKLSMWHRTSRQDIILQFHAHRDVGVIVEGPLNFVLSKQVDLSMEEIGAMSNLDRGTQGRLIRFEEFYGFESHPEYPFHSHRFLARIPISADIVYPDAYEFS